MIVSKGSVIILSHPELLTVRLDHGRNLPVPPPFEPFLVLCRLLSKSFMT